MKHLPTMYKAWDVNKVCLHRKDPKDSTGKITTHLQDHQAKHLKLVLIERFLSFLNQIEKSKKLIPKQLLSFIKHDVRSTTGSNLRNILQLTNKNTIEEISLEDI